MGQRGHRRYRFRCRYVDLDTGLRCRVQVKRAGCKFCCREHAWAAMRGLPQPQQPRAAKGWYLATRQAHQARLREQLRSVGLDGELLEQVLAVAMAAGDERYSRGYTAGHGKATETAKRLKLETSKHVLIEFVGSKVGKVFTNGNIGHDALADFSFGLGR